MLADPATEGQVDAQVFLWRRERFLLLGFNRRQASRLAAVQADWHQADELLRSGCPVLVAFDILDWIAPAARA